ncbi:hypothetical protein LAWI1_G000707 [Lachnellula willkommii]|uniref:Uncharacterized protein n=1 Tax=Lachnellula willkommii TaxID=215461 RepID=A0A559MMR3_9HELO|nr:hypothetical protein LAWI1_G000707 [Lachnellula willkommii]
MAANPTSPRLAESPPISPLTLPRGDSSFPNTQRLDPIVEHEVAVHARPGLRDRTASLTSVSFKGPSQTKPKAKGKSRPSSLRGASPPPPPCEVIQIKAGSANFSPPPPSHAHDSPQPWDSLG